jgi:hypothetical protein
VPRAGQGLLLEGPEGKGAADGFRKTVFGVPLAGCPLEEKISEFHMVRRAASRSPRSASSRWTTRWRRHRPPHLQRLHEVVHLPEAEPVDIPQAETRTLKDVLELPWGFEIYSLLTRWNPSTCGGLSEGLREKESWSSGLGPAGFTSPTTS